MEKKLKIALVADEATSISIAPDANLILLTPQNYKFKIQLFKPDLLFVESCWRGYKNSWKKHIVDIEINQSMILIKLIEYCNALSIPTVFWNKEDPLHFERFKYTASLFDYIYTTDMNSITKYENYINHKVSSIKTLLFCAQPKYHYPPKSKRQDGTVFLGGYYGNEIPERSLQQEAILNKLTKHNLIIYDRFYSKKTACSYPQELNLYCIESISQKQCFNVYKKYQIYLNFNSIIDSPTMLSRRVFELAACKSPIISTGSIAIEHLFENKITVVDEKTNFDKLFKEFILTDEFFENINHLYELVMDMHIWKHRLKQIKIDLF